MQGRIKNDMNEEFKYVLCYMHYGWDGDKFSNDLEDLDREAKEMIRTNSAKPLIIVNGDDEIVKEYAERKR